MFEFYKIPPKYTTNETIIHIHVYGGDGDGAHDRAIGLRGSEKAPRRYFEILAVEHQFKHGRGGCRSMYDQRFYFRPMADTIFEDDGYWEWLDEVPVWEDGEQNYTVSFKDMIWTDSQGRKFEVLPNEHQRQFLDDLEEINKQHRIDHMDVWDFDINWTKLAQDQEYEKSFFQKYLDYRADVVALIDKHVEYVSNDFESTTEEM